MEPNFPLGVINTAPQIGKFIIKWSAQYLVSDSSNFLFSDILDSVTAKQIVNVPVVLKQISIPVVLKHGSNVNLTMQLSYIS